MSRSSNCSICFFPAASRGTGTASTNTPRLKTIHQVNGVAAEAEETLAQAQDALAGVDEMTDAVTSMSENMDTFVTENAVSIEQVMKKLEAKNLAQLVRKSLENGLFLKKT